MRPVVFSFVIVSVFVFLGLYFGAQKVEGQTNPNQCQIYHDKAKELAEKSAEELPQGQTLGFDPRIAKSKASLAYSQIYRNCKEWGE